MHLLSSLLTAGVFVSYLSLLHPKASALGLFSVIRDEIAPLKSSANGDAVGKGPSPQINESVDDDDTDNDEEEEMDFEDDSDSDIKEHLVGLEPQNVNSVTHLHQKQGEILVPCFGMWWPVGGGGGGGGGVTYDYVEGDYYDDYRRKKKRAKKQKKAAKRRKRKKA